MFGLRSDGKKVKINDPIQRLVPHFMDSRTASQNFIFQDIDCVNLDNFIRTERENGKSYNYMHIVIATIVRVFYLKPELNRFVVNGRLFDRYAKDGKNIQVSITVKKHLTIFLLLFSSKLVRTCGTRLHCVNNTLGKTIFVKLSQSSLGSPPL